VRKGQRRLDGLDKTVLSLYARGMTTRDICEHLLEIYGVEVSPDLISKITDAVHAEVAGGRRRRARLDGRRIGRPRRRDRGPPSSNTSR
jgi:transposase-like protein